MTFQLHIQYEFQQQVFELVEESFFFQRWCEKMILAWLEERPLSRCQFIAASRILTYQYKTLNIKHKHHALKSLSKASNKIPVQFWCQANTKILDLLQNPQKETNKLLYFINQTIQTHPYKKITTFSIKQYQQANYLTNDYYATRILP